MTNDRMPLHDVDLYFYEELTGEARAAFERHLPGCPACKAALDDLEQIRGSLAPMRAQAGRSEAEWRSFMRRLDVRLDGRPTSAVHGGYMIPVLAMAATLLIGIGAGALWQRERARTADSGTSAVALDQSATGNSASAASQARAKEREAVLAHLDRAKIVLLGLANKDAGAVSADDWAYERSLAASLLPDTRLLRLGALEAGDAELASLLNDLEVLMLQASFAAEPDRVTLSQLQRYINRRDLLVRTELGL
jgi:hypothetical protein